MSPEGDTGFLLEELNWNFGYPEATPILDVIAAVVLFFASKAFRNIV